MSWYFAFTAAMPEIAGYGLSVTSNGHIGPDTFSSALVDVKHVQFVAETTPTD